MGAEGSGPRHFELTSYVNSPLQLPYQSETEPNLYVSFEMLSSKYDRISEIYLYHYIRGWKLQFPNLVISKINANLSGLVSFEREKIK